MIQLSESDIRRKVRLTLNEYQDNEAEFYTSSDDTELDALIAEKSLEALRFVHGHADVSLLDSDSSISEIPGASIHTSLIGMTERNGVLAVMEDYYRLVRARLSSWQKIFTDNDLDSDSEYVKQNDKYAQGTYENPKLFLIKKNNAYQLEFYCAESDTDTVEVEYLSEPEMKEFTPTSEDEDAYNYYEVSARLEEAFIYYLTGLVLLALNDSHADDMFNLATTLMGIQAQQEGK